ALLPGADALGELGHDLRLTLVGLARVGVARVHHHPRGQAGRAHLRHGRRDRLGVVVRAGGTAAQDHVTIGVARGLHDRGAPLGVGAEEYVAGRRRAAAVDRDLHVAVGAVLEADRHRQARDQLAVDLALRGPRADRAPGDGVGDVLRTGGLEELGADGQAGVQHVEQQLAGRPQAARDVVAAVERWIVDEALPPDGGARLLEVHA